MFILFVFSLRSYSLPDISVILDDNEYSEVFKYSLKNVLKFPANYYNDKYMFSYSCGGGAMCFSVYEPVDSKVFNFSDAFIVDDFVLIYSKQDKEFYVSGESGYDDTIYDKACYFVSKSEIRRCEE